MASTAPIIVAHRGLHAMAPENSIESFRLAHAAGIQWIECDVQASKDGVAVLIHDEKLDRETHGEGEVRHHPWQTLSGLLRRKDDSEPWGNDYRLESLADAVQVVPKSLRLLVEIKPFGAGQFVDNVVKLLRTTDLYWIIQSFDPANVARASELVPDRPAVLLVETSRQLERAIKDRRPHVHVQHDLLDETSAGRMREAGMKFGAWTVNREEDVRRVARVGAEMIISDKPLEAKRVLGL